MQKMMHCRNNFTEAHAIIFSVFVSWDCILIHHSIKEASNAATYLVHHPAICGHLPENSLSDWGSANIPWVLRKGKNCVVLAAKGLHATKLSCQILSKFHIHNISLLFHIEN